MNVTGKTRISYELHHTGRIFVTTQTDLVDDNGNVVSTSPPHRAPYEPMQLRQNPLPKNDKDPGGPVQIVDTDLSQNPDEKLRALAALHWTPEVKAAHRAQLAARLVAAPPATPAAAAKGKNR
jgi:hypothetical protein